MKNINEKVKDSTIKKIKEFIAKYSKAKDLYKGLLNDVEKELNDFGITKINAYTDHTMNIESQMGLFLSMFLEKDNKTKQEFIKIDELIKKYDKAKDVYRCILKDIEVEMNSIGINSKMGNTHIYSNYIMSIENQISLFENKYI